MSTEVSSPVSTLAVVLGTAAELAAATLPDLGGWTVEHVEPGQAGSAAQPPAAKAAQCEVTGFGRVVLAVAGPLARAVQVGPPPAEDLPEGLTPAILRAIESLAASLAVELVGGDVVEVGADVALLPSTGETVTAVRLLDGESHVATLAIVHVEGADGIEEDDEAAHDFPVLESAPVSVSGHPLELLSDVELGVTVELGRTRMLLREILQLAPGSVIELDRAAGGPVDLLVNNTLVARGEVVVIDEEFGLRVTEVVGYDPNKSV